ncbi:MAG: heme exporter protein CcmB [Deltaproteobacteria bacterium]|nr:heme exporter protein CcmB [Deltaproteobacteria bacterium]
MTGPRGGRGKGSGTLLQLVRKDLLVGWHGRARLVGLSTYAVTLLLVFSFALGPDTATLHDHASAYAWVALLSASTLLLAQSFLQEVEGGALEGLLLLPVSPVALFYAKALANLLLLLVLAGVLLPLGAVLFDVSPSGPPLALAGILALGCAGLVAPGTLYAALTARVASQQVLLPVLLFPLVVPPVLASVKATALLVDGDPMGQLGAWAGLLVAFDVLYWSLCGVLFGRVLEA